MFEKEKFGQRLAEARIEKGFTRETFAKLVGLSTEMVQNYETGDFNSAFASQIASVLGEELQVNPEWLLGFSEVKWPDDEGSKIDKKYSIETIAKNLKRLRRSAKLTVKDVHFLLEEKGENCAQKTIYNWEAGRRNMNVDQAFLLCDIYGVADEDVKIELTKVVEEEE
ncbi:transcriptional regulator with XRE-family HTH domain [Lachnospiraceae bacterium PF1-22]